MIEASGANQMRVTLLRKAETESGAADSGVIPEIYIENNNRARGYHE